MKSFVTGIDGFIGGWLARLLVDRGDEVFGLSRKTAQITGDSVQRVAGDVRDAKALDDAMKRIAPDRVFHLAALNHIGASFESPEETFEINVTGTLRLLAAVRAHASNATFVSVGSSGEYGDTTRSRDRVNEDDPLLPTSPYGISKVTQGLLCRQQHRAYGLRTVHVRPFAIVGPGKKGDALTQFAEQIARIEEKKGGALSVGNLEAVRDFVDVRDCAKALVFLADRGESGHTYNICSGIGTTMRAIVDELRNKASVPIDIKEDPARMRPVDDLRIVGDATKITALGYSPRYSLGQTTTDTLDQFRAKKTC